MGSYRIAIPARMASTRLPGKPLADVAGRPLIVRVVEGALAASAQSVLVVADDQRILDAVLGMQVDTLLTPADLPSGTDRIAYAATVLGWEPDACVVNLQGDEPLIPAALLDRLAAVLQRGDAPMATVATPINDIASLDDPNQVKVVCDHAGRALYFSRAPIPFDRDGRRACRLAPSGALRHLGLYAYRVGFLQCLARTPVAALEALEQLEQLRVLAMGERIQVLTVDSAPPPGVDTQDDLVRVAAVFSGR
ncbi:MAG: 3-deoxy-manno-octulosonate cytidylyltransferase [Thioalkalivibrionaceae bacterium]